MRFVILDVFTDTAFTGNQLAVFPDGAQVPDHLRQTLAREIGFSETVFVDPPAHPVAGDAAVRIFTPWTELPFAGHPVLGAAVCIAAEQGLAGGSVITLACGIGPVPVELDADAQGGWMRQPLPTVEPLADAAPLLAALGVPERALVAPVERYVNGPSHVLVVVDDPALVLGLAPDHGGIIASAGPASVSVSALTGPDAVECRVFVPGAGIPEDPATGSAAGPLGVHLLRHGLLTPATLLTISQGVTMGRPARLYVRVEGIPDAIAAVGVGGRAVVVGEGAFR